MVVDGIRAEDVPDPPPPRGRRLRTGPGRRPRSGGSRSMRRLQARLDRWRLTPGRQAGADPHRATLEAYERDARGVAGPPATPTGRRPRLQPPGSTAPTPPVVDLGCGPGWHLPELPPGTDRAWTARPPCWAWSPTTPRGALRVRADLRALPFGRHRAGRGVGQQELRPPGPTRRCRWPCGTCTAPCGWVRPRSWACSAATTTTGPSTTTRSRAGRSPPGPTACSPTCWPEPGSASTSWDRHELPGVPFLAVTVRRERTLADTVGAGHAPAAGRAQPVAVRGRRRCRLRPPRQPGLARRCWPPDWRPWTAIPVHLLAPPPHRHDRPGQAGHGAGRRTRRRPSTADGLAAAGRAVRLAAARRGVRRRA